MSKVIYTGFHLWGSVSVRFGVSLSSHDFILGHNVSGRNYAKLGYIRGVPSTLPLEVSWFRAVGVLLLDCLYTYSHPFLHYINLVPISTR